MHGTAPRRRSARPLAAAPGAAVAWLVSGRTAAGLAAQAGRLARSPGGAPGPGPGRRGLVAGHDPVGVRAPGGGHRRGPGGAGGRPGRGGGRAARPPAWSPGRRGRRRAGWCSCSRARAASGPGWAGSWPRPARCSRRGWPSAARRWPRTWTGTWTTCWRRRRRRLDRADVVQPALWAVMVSLAAVWQAAGVTPDAVVGPLARARSRRRPWPGSCRWTTGRGRGAAQPGAARRWPGRAAMVVGGRARRAVRDRIAGLGRPPVGGGGQRPGGRPWSPASPAALGELAAGVRGRTGCGPGCCRWTTPRTAPQVEPAAGRARWPR